MSAPNRVDELRKRYHENPRRFFAPLANEYRKTGFVDRAILLCEKHLGEQPGNMNGLVVYGQCLFETGRLDEARQPFEAALGLDPENLIALRHLGDIARLGGDT
ncbi:MAG TPA: tetratricopeptide repeat protein, partial [Thermoanaerobaculia bacterium]|nr:tetratricopeptide repeat protein [Thermoanaerobaculia bacterium]